MRLPVIYYPTRIYHRSLPSMSEFEVIKWSPHVCGRVPGHLIKFSCPRVHCVLDDRMYQERYLTLSVANQNCVPPTSEYPRGPMSQSAQIRNFNCLFPSVSGISTLETRACDVYKPDGAATGRENPIFSNSIGLGSTSHQFADEGGDGNTERSGLLPVGGSSYICEHYAQ